jgi:hypothetical protein
MKICPYCQQPTKLIEAWETGDRHDCEPCQASFTIEGYNGPKLFYTDLSFDVKGEKWYASFYHKTQTCSVMAPTDTVPGMLYEVFSLSFIPDWTPSNIAQKVKGYIIFS